MRRSFDKMCLHDARAVRIGGRSAVLEKRPVDQEIARLPLLSRDFPTGGAAVLCIQTATNTEPFLGTGTFVTRLLQSGIIKPDQLQHKYKHEIFANEIVLLSYYIASINIEAVYREICKENGILDDDAEFPGIVLADTFQNTENAQTGDITGAFATNLERIERQRNANIQVVMMNPPYSAGQKNANDGNQNNRYPWLFNRIATTYATQSSQTNKNSLYDSYFLALRWASDRIKDEGIIAFVSNSSFIDGAAAEGVRKCWQSEFSEIYVFDLKGNARTSGERRRQEGGNIFDSGSRTGVAITVLIKKKNHQGDANIYHLEIDDYLSRQEKLEEIKRQGRIKKSAFTQITPNAHGDWITERDEEFATYQLIGSKDKKLPIEFEPVFKVYSRGLATARDAWCWNFSEEAVVQNISRMIENYNNTVVAGFTTDNVEKDSTRISWNRELLKFLDRKKKLTFDEKGLRRGLFRPFTRGTLYFSKELNDQIYQIPRLYPSELTKNLSFCISGSSVVSCVPIMVEILPDLHLNGDSQCFSLYSWEPDFSTEEPDLFSASAEVESTEVGSTSASKHFDFSRPISDQIPLYLDGYKRVDNISDATLSKYQEHYADTQISKEDIFFYIYALLHHPEYRERFEGDLRKGLPRIPLCTDFWDYVQIGRELADLHVNYESVEPYPLSIEFAANAPTDEWDLFQVKKMEWAKLGKQKDFSKLVYNPFITISGLPVEVNEYKVSGRSPLEWLIDRYQVKIDKASGILNDPNAYFREVNNPRYLFDLIQSLVTVSIRTQNLLKSLPPFNVD